MNRRDARKTSPDETLARPGGANTSLESLGLLLACVLLLCSCSSDPAGATETSATEDAWEFEVELAPCGFAEPTAATVEIRREQDIFHVGPVTRIKGLVLDETPRVLHEVTMESGGCRYLQPAFTSCAPICAPGEYCNEDATCVPEPASVGAGTLGLLGLGEHIEIEGYDYSPGTYNGPTDLSEDAFDESTEIGAHFSGDEFPEITLGAMGVAGIDADLSDTGFLMEDGGDAVVSWTAGPDPEACISVIINGKNPAHGAPLDDIIECEGPDNGSLTIPQAMVEAFPLGETPEITNNYDWPFSTLTRYTRSRTQTGDGDAELIVASTTAFRVNHTE